MMKRITKKKTARPEISASTPSAETSPFEKAYPNIANWVMSDGQIEIGLDDYHRSFVRALDEGGMVWEGGPRYATLEEALLALDAGIAKWIEENW